MPGFDQIKGFEHAYTVKRNTGNPISWFFAKTGFWGGGVRGYKSILILHEAQP
jgi:hypothetical protein